MDPELEEVIFKQLMGQMARQKFSNALKGAPQIGPGPGQRPAQRSAVGDQPIFLQELGRLFGEEGEGGAGDLPGLLSALFADTNLAARNAPEVLGQGGKDLEFLIGRLLTDFFNDPRNAAQKIASEREAFQAKRDSAATASREARQGGQR